MGQSPPQVDLSPPAALDGCSDDALMALAASDRRDAMQELVRRYQARVRSYLQRAVPGASDDLAQEVFLALWQARQRYRAEGRFVEYLFTLVRNRCRNAARDLGRRSSGQEQLEQGQGASPGAEPAPPGPGALDELLARERAHRLKHEVLALQPKLREALVLRFDEGLEYAEIARIVGAPEATVRSRVFLGIKSLREKLASAEGRA